MSLKLIPFLKGACSLALIGMGKNVGKTTALNALVEEAGQLGLQLGMTSIGRDGELLDAISNHPKPPIRVPVGSILGTVAGALPEGDGVFEVIETTQIRTALGPVLLLRALRPVQWELTGPALGSSFLWLRQRFLELGCQLILFDGAFDRRSSATPSLSDATLLVSGAALDPDMQVVIQETAHRVKLFSLEENQQLPRAARELLDDHGVGFWRNDDTVERLPVRSALGAHDQVIAGLQTSDRGLLIGSALTPRLLRALEPHGAQSIVVRDGTSALLDPADLKRFLVRGGQLSALRKIHLPFLVANPFSPYGWRYDPYEFLDRLAEAVSPIPVVDVVLGESRGLEVGC